MKSYNAVVLGGMAINNALSSPILNTLHQGGGTGKSCLTLRYMREMFVDSYDPTIEESYRKAVKVDGELCNLEVLDTAGADQFTSMNEWYIKGSTGFILVFSLTQASSMREVENLRQQIFRVKGLPTPTPFSVDDFAETDEVGSSSIMRRRPPVLPGGGRRYYPNNPPKRLLLDGSEEGSRTSGEDMGDKYHHIPAARGTDPIPLVIVGTKCDLEDDREVSREMAIRMATLWGVPYYETSAKFNINVNDVFMDIIRQMREHYPAGTKRLQPMRKRKKKGPCSIQ